MQPIIVAVDFSNTSLHAVEYAICLANKMKSDIHLVWVDKIITQESVYPDTSNESRNEAKRRFDELTSQCKTKLLHGLSIDYKLKKGRIHREVDSLARSTSAELIVTGAHGISGFEEFWIGSNAYKIVTFTSTPVITVRHDFEIRNCIDRILVPIDGSNETIQKLLYSVKLAKLFDAEIYLLTTHNNHLKSIQRIADKYAQKAVTWLKKNDVKFVEDSLISSDLTKAVLNYAVDVQADLITIMTEQETPLNIHIGAQAQQLINQSPIPVLSITPIENFNLI
ncbi:MAG: universal stress protein [Bacteroidetes bacterium]|nr:universal stress protein [Bacteroidota bacterium]